MMSEHVTSLLDLSGISLGVLPFFAVLSFQRLNKAFGRANSITIFLGQTAASVTAASISPHSS
jgi:hypothetical protein